MERGDPTPSPSRIAVIVTAWLGVVAVAAVAYWLVAGDAALLRGRQRYAYRESLKIKPTFTYSLYNLALLYGKQDRAPEAIELLRKVIELEPNQAFAQHALGVMYVRTGEKTGAMQQYYALQNLNPKLAADLLSMIGQ